MIFIVSILDEHAEVYAIIEEQILHYIKSKNKKYSSLSIDLYNWWRAFDYPVKIKLDGSHYIEEIDGTQHYIIEAANICAALIKASELYNQPDSEGDMKRTCTLCGKFLTSRARPTIYRISKNPRNGAPDELYVCTQCARSRDDKKGTETLKSVLDNYKKAIEGDVS